MIQLKLSSLMMSGILLAASGSLALAAPDTDDAQRLQTQQQLEVRQQNQGEDSQIRNRFNDSKGKGEMIRQRNMDGSAFGGSSGNMGGNGGKGKR